MKTRISLVIMALALFLHSEAFASEAITLWATPDAASISEISNIGVVAYHWSGIDRVEFVVNGELFPEVLVETLNPTTKEYEFVLELNTLDFSENEWITIVATAFPNDGEAYTLPSRKFIVQNSSTYNSWFVDETGNDANIGSETAPFKTILKALNSATGGDEIFIGNGAFHLPGNWNNDFDKFVYLRQKPGTTGYINSTNAFDKGMLKVIGIFFDYSVINDSYDIIKTSVNAHLWFDSCTFKGLGQENYTNQLTAVRSNYDGEHVTVENSTVMGTSRAFVVSGKGNHIVRNNKILNLSSDAFNPRSNVLITGNEISGINSPALYVENLNMAPFDLSQDKDLAIHLCSSSNSCDSADYDIYTFSDLGSLANDPSAVNLTELINAINANTDFFAEGWAEERFGKLRIYSRTKNFVQQMWISGSARDILGFSEINVSTQAEGAGAHSDIIQYWGSKNVQDTVQNLIFRNNKSYDNYSQGIYLGDNTRSINIAVVNNLVDKKGKGGWNVNLSDSPDEGEKFYNLLFQYNTIWDGGTSFDARSDKSSEDMYIRNNVIGRRYMGLGDVDGWNCGNNFYLWYHWQEPPLDPTSIIIKTALTDPITIFENVVYDPETMDDHGDFNLVSNSPPRDKADNTSGIIYDIDWNLRDQFTDIGAYEYRYLGDTILYDTLCAGDSIYFDNQWIKESSSSRVFTQTISAQEGGDSTIVLKIYFFPSIDPVKLENEICGGDSIFLQNDWQTLAGIYYDTLLTENGCNSIVITNLSVNSINTDVMYKAEENTLICMGYGDQNMWKDCQTDDVLSTDSIFVYDHSGEYYLEIIKGNCSAKSDCKNVVFTNIIQNSLSGLKIFPNPADDILTVSLGYENNISMKLIRADGALMMSKEYNHAENIELSVEHLTPGIYILRINNSTNTRTFRFIKK